MTHKNSAGRKHDGFKTLNYTSSTAQKLPESSFQKKKGTNAFGVKRKLFESSF